MYSRYRQMGVIGAAMIVKQIAQCRQLSNTTLLHQNASPPWLSATRQQRVSFLPFVHLFPLFLLLLLLSLLPQARSMIQQVIESCKNHRDAVTLFYDEMAIIMQKGIMDSRSEVVAYSCTTVSLRLTSL